MAAHLERATALANALGDKESGNGFTASDLRESYWLSFLPHFYARGVPEFNGAALATLSDEQLAYLYIVQMKRFVGDVMKSVAVRQIDSSTASAKAEAVAAVDLSVKKEAFAG